MSEEQDIVNSTEAEAAPRAEQVEIPSVPEAVEAQPDSAESPESGPETPVPMEPEAAATDATNEEEVEGLRMGAEYPPAERQAETPSLEPFHRHAAALPLDTASLDRWTRRLSADRLLALSCVDPPTLDSVAQSIV